MGTDKQDFFKWRQDAFYLQINITDALSDLSSYKAYWVMASGSTATASPVLVKTTPGHFSAQGGITWSAGDTVRITIAESDTAGFLIQDYYHELTIEDLTGNSSVVSVGTFDLRQAIFPYR
jgi:hypothetical protein